MDAGMTNPDDVVVSISLMRLRRQRVCPRWATPDFDVANCWCHSSRQDDGKMALCPTKPASIEAT
jgi:hypothetical protein